LKKFNGIVPLLLCFTACQPIDVFEKNVSIPGFAWASDFKPEVSFEITDTTSLYTTFIVLRHMDAYRYKNMWVNVHIKPPSGPERVLRAELKLATDEKGWLGSGMDDIFEHRIQLTSPEPLVAGTYTIRLENIMREDPLKNVMDVGIRLEKSPK
jgi:gliding motility-associated lipoprotein GldH